MFTNDEYNTIVSNRKNNISIRKTAKELGRSRATVTKYYKGEKFPGQVKDSGNFRQARPEGASSERIKQEDEIITFCLEVIDRHKNDPLKQKLNKRKLHEEVVTKFGEVAYSTLCRWLARRNILNNADTFVKLQFDPGITMQADFCEYKLKLIGQEELVSVKLFCCVMPYSNEPFVAVLPDEKRHNLMFAIQMALEYFGGVPKEIIFDNMKQVVDAEHGKKAKINEHFKKFANHYGFEILCANKASGHEKSYVENLCNHSRTFLWKIGPVSCLREVQDHLLMKIAVYREKAKLKRKTKSVMEMSTEERMKLDPLPNRRFTEGDQKEVKVNKFLTFLYDTCEYSVPLDNPGIMIGIRATPYEITCYYKGINIYDHTRSILKYQDVLVAEHYLDVYEQKPRSIKNSMALKTGILPAELNEFRSKCAEKDVNEQLVKIMLLSRKYDPKIVKEAVIKAIENQKPTYDSVCRIINITENCGPEVDERHDGQWVDNDEDDFEADDLSIYDDDDQDEDDE
jgi:transposase